MTDTVAAAAPSSEPLSIEAATGLLSTVPTEAVELPPEEPEAEAELAADSTTETEADPTAEEEPGAETPAEEPIAEQPEPDLPAVEPPTFWDAEGKEAFAALPREAQAVVRAQADKQGAAASKAISEAAQRAQQAEGQASKVTQLAAELNAFLPKAIETFKGRWDQVDWVFQARNLSPQDYQAVRAEYEAETQQLEQLRVASQTAETERFQQFLRAESAKLPVIAPDLIDPKEGSGRMQKVMTFLNERGYTPEQIRHVTAEDLGIAYDALRWREAQASARKAAAAPKPAPKPIPVAPKPSGQVKPTAAAPLAPTRQRSVEIARVALSKEASVDNAVALLRAMRN